MSKLRPECGYDRTGEFRKVPRDTALFLIRDAVLRRRGLIHGRLHDRSGGHCAMGCFWQDNPKLTIDEDLLDEVAAVNDSLGPIATPQQRWKKVSVWLRFKIKSLTVAKKGV